MKRAHMNHLSAVKHIKTVALFTAEAYQMSRLRKRPEWRYLPQAEMALELLGSAIDDIRRSLGELGPGETSLARGRPARR